MPTIPNSTVERRIEELRNLLDNGTIDQQYFDESVEKLRGKYST